MQRRDIGLKIAEEYKLTDVMGQRIVERIFDLILKTIMDEGRLEFRNFGVFSIKERKQRKARNPKTGQAVIVPRRKVLVFKAGCNIKKKIQGK